MIRGTHRKSSEAGLGDRDDPSRRSSVEGSVPSVVPSGQTQAAGAEATVLRGPSTESPDLPSGGAEAAVLLGPSAESPCVPSSGAEAAVLQGPSTESQGLPSAGVGHASSHRGAFEAMVLSREELERLALPSTQLHPLLRSRTVRRRV